MGKRRRRDPDCVSLSHLFPKIVIRRGVEKLTQTAIGRSLKKHLQCKLSQVVTPLITRPSRECRWGFAGAQGVRLGLPRWSPACPAPCARGGSEFRPQRVQHLKIVTIRVLSEGYILSLVEVTFVAQVLRLSPSFPGCTQCHRELC